MKNIHIALIALSLAVPVLPAVANSSQVEAAHAAVKRLLKDPASARFHNQVLRPGAVCGSVNAKNAYGGYAGDKLYYYVISTKRAVILDELTGNNSVDQDDLDRLKKYCGL